MPVFSNLNGEGKPWYRFYRCIVLEGVHDLPFVASVNHMGRFHMDRSAARASSSTGSRVCH